MDLSFNLNSECSTLALMQHCEYLDFVASTWALLFCSHTTFHTNPSPTAPATWKGIQKSEFALRDISLRLARLMSNNQCPHELSSLSTTGRSATFLGVLGTLQGFGIVSTNTSPPREGPMEDWVRLGQGSYQKMLMKTAVAGKFCKAFNNVHIASVGSVEELESMHEELERLRAGANLPELKFGGGYVWPHVARKLVMGALAAASSQGDGRTLNWYTVSKELLVKIVPDENEVLNVFPDDWTVGEIGELVFGSSEQGFYASCWGCLFQAPIDAWPDLVQEMHALFGNRRRFQLAFTDVSGDFVAPTPIKLVSGQLPFKNVKRAKKTPNDHDESRCFNKGLAAAPAAPTRSATRSASLATTTGKVGKKAKAPRRIGAKSSATRQGGGKKWRLRCKK